MSEEDFELVPKATHDELAQPETMPVVHEHCVAKGIYLRMRSSSNGMYWLYLEGGGKPLLQASLLDDTEKDIIRYYAPCVRAYMASMPEAVRKQWEAAWMTCKLIGRRSCL